MGLLLREGEGRAEEWKRREKEKGRTTCSP